ncbi:MAG: response regulator transcription factor [Lachnospiraceae bacterium]|nr:response regulator transcription factor [Lachnospiraceae bacterium]
MKIAICDDCRQDALHLKTLLNGKHDTVFYSNTKQLLTEVKEEGKHYDLYLIDIYMQPNDMNGIELAEELRKKEEESALCFISSSDDFYREAYDLYAVQYLLKPVQQEELDRLLEQVSRRMEKELERSLQFRWRGHVGRISYGKILFVTSREHTVFIHCKDGQVQECVGKLSEIAAKICGEVFLRCHQSFIVNMYCVNSMNGNELSVSGNSIPVSRRYLADVKRRYQEILFEEME